MKPPADSAAPDAYPHIYVSDTDLAFPDYATLGYGRYVDFQPLARGGSAVLQVCRDKNLGRTVVMKTLLGHLADNEAMRARFLREARVTAQLQHPSTVPVYDLGYDLDRRLYFTMKKLEGQTLRRILERQSAGDAETLDKFDLQRILDILLQVCDCLSFAHVHGVVHRDVKPENILVGHFGETTILDWGVAKVWGREESEETLRMEHEVLTDVNQRPGTPLYMAPEQVRGGGRQIDARTDVYAVGAVLYEVLTLCEPLRGKHVQETFEMIINAAPAPPRERAPGRSIPAPLAAVAMKAMNKNPDDRYASMAELIDAIRDFKSQAMESLA